MTAHRRLWIGLLVLALLSPLGLYLPELMRAGSAWGEWGLEEIRALLGYVPEGMERTAGVWKAALPDYAFPGADNGSRARLSAAYVVSAILGMAACAGGVYLVGRWLFREKR